MKLWVIGVAAVPLSLIIQAGQLSEAINGTITMYLSTYFYLHAFVLLVRRDSRAAFPVITHAPSHHNGVTKQ